MRSYLRPTFAALICWILVGSSFAQDATLIQNVNVWNGTGDDLVMNQEVLIEGNLISAVGANLDAPANATVIDGAGRTLIPGLSDAHVHLAINVSGGDMRTSASFDYMTVRSTVAAKNFLMLGFTTVRDLGGPVIGLQRAIDEGTVPGPRIYPSGAFLSQTSGHGDFRGVNDPNSYWAGGIAHPFESMGWSFIVDGVPEVLKAVRENLKRGSTQLKLMAGGGISSQYDPLHTVQFTSEELEAAVQAAADWDTYVTVHAYNPEGIMRALEAGVRCIDHGHLVNEEAMQMIKEKDAWLVPQSYWSLRPAEGASPKFRQAQAGANNEMDLAKKYGVKLAFGTDAFGPLGSEARALMEFTSRARWFEPVEILKQATTVNAALFAESGQINPYTEGKLGVIEPGAYADLLIYDGNPLEDIQVIVNYRENLKLIMKDGVIHKNELD